MASNHGVGVQIPLEAFGNNKLPIYAVCLGGEEATLKVVGPLWLAGSNPVGGVLQDLKQISCGLWLAH